LLLLMSGLSFLAGESPAGAEEPDAETVDAASWPGTQKGLVWFWQNNEATNSIEDEKGRTLRTCRVVARDRARFGRFHDMLLSGGAVLADQADGMLLKSFKAADGLTIEALITPAEAKKDEPKRIITFSTDLKNRNFSVSQDGRKLMLQLRTTENAKQDKTKPIALGSIPAGKPTHVVLTYAPGDLKVYFNGKCVRTLQTVDGTFANWRKSHLLFGDEFKGGADWSGRLEHVAIYSRALEAAEVARKYKLIAGELKKRKPVEKIVVEAKLVATSETPDPKELVKEAYRRCLVMYGYEVKKVVSGKLTSRKFSAGHWAILDAKKIPLKLEKGRTYRLTLHPWDAHPELTGERRADDLPNEYFDHPMLFDPTPVRE
ncbi:MAG: LamG domain-containing protein, partial [Phycisphaerae bacterium]